MVTLGKGKIIRWLAVMSTPSLQPAIFGQWNTFKKRESLKLVLHRPCVSMTSTLSGRAALGERHQASGKRTSVSQSRFSILYLRSLSAQALGGWKVLLNTMSFSSSTFAASRSFSCQPGRTAFARIWSARSLSRLCR